MSEKTKRVDIEATQITPELWLVKITLIENGIGSNTGQLVMTESQLGFFNALRTFTGIENDF